MAKIFGGTPKERMAGCSSVALALVLSCVSFAGCQLLAPSDADIECLTPNTATNKTGIVLIDSYQYLSLEGLWFADDEDIDLYEFPVPEDPVRWKLVDLSSCRNVWQYCGNSSSDILISQLVTSQQRRGGGEVIVSVEYSFFHNSEFSEMEMCTVELSEEDSVLIVEVDGLTGIDNIHTEFIPQCVDNEPLTRHDFVYTPAPMTSNFELVFRSNLSDETCVNISRVHVFYCDDTTLALQDANSSLFTCNMCPELHYLDIEAEQCFLCPSHSSNTAGNLCTCEMGYERSAPDNFSLPCDQCSSGYFSSDNGSCVACPVPGFDSIGSTVDACRCFNESLLIQPSTSSRACQFCAANYFRNSSLDECVLCPTGASRELEFDSSGEPLLEAEQSCTCRFSEMSTYTLYWNGSQCVSCPNNSQVDPRHNQTIIQRCFCVSGFYRPTRSSECQSCPVNSFRALSEPEETCSCLEGYRVDSVSSSLECFAYIGFSTDILLLAEGNVLGVNNLTVILSAAAGDETVVNVSVASSSSSRDIAARILPGIADFSNGVRRLEVSLIHVGNEVALEEDVTLNISLDVSMSAMGRLLVGGPGLFGTLRVVISDDDLLYAGFPMNRQTYEGCGQRNGSIRVDISSIGRELVLLIRTNGTLSMGFQPSQPGELTFLPGNQTSKYFDFDISPHDCSATRYVMISVEVASPSESALQPLPAHLYQHALLVLGSELESGSGGMKGLSKSALIGLISSVVMVCFNLIVITCLLARVLRKRQRLSGPGGGSGASTDEGLKQQDNAVSCRTKEAEEKL